MAASHPSPRSSLRRSLDCSEANGDYTYAKALDFAVSRGILSAAERRVFEKSFNRGDMLQMCYNSQYLKRDQSRLTLLSGAVVHDVG